MHERMRLSYKFTITLNVDFKLTIFASLAESGLNHLPVFQLFLLMANEQQRRSHNLMDGMRRVLISSDLRDRGLFQVKNVLREGEGTVRSNDSYSKESIHVQEQTS